MSGSPFEQLEMRYFDMASRTGSCGAAKKTVEMTAPAIAPRMGASQNNQSCESAPPCTNSAGPVERAGLMDALVTGIATRLVRVRVSPIAALIGAAEAAPFQGKCKLHLYSYQLAINHRVFTRPDR